jgi:hypothetical protein
MYPTSQELATKYQSHRFFLGYQTLRTKSLLTKDTGKQDKRYSLSRDLWLAENSR